MKHNKVRQPITATRLLLNPLAVALALALSAGPGASLAQMPGGASVVSGSANITTLGDRMTVGTSPNAIINWQSFSIGASQSVRFEQPDAASQVLNRVVGTGPSQLLGTLSSNGKVWLINPNGVLFGAGARIDVASLVASTLGVTDADFLAGRAHFNGSAPGRLLNQGEIRTPTGGRVWLIGSEVGNEGLIETPGGEIVLAAGRSIELVDASAPRLTLKLSAPTDQALNLGQLIAQRGSVELHGAIVNQQGLIRADSVGVDAAGRIVLRAKRDLTLGENSITSASAAGSGRAGEIVAQSESGTTRVSGRVETVSASGMGGQVTLLGQQVGLIGSALVDVSGAIAGGELLVGVDFQGGNPALPNSHASYVSAGATLRADATDRGDGGRLIVWGDDTTRAHGTLSARGGPQGGNGGLVETSGHFLDVTGARVDAGAAKGVSGQWLLASYALDVVPGTSTIPSGNDTDVVFNSSADISTVFDSDISAALSAGSNVTLRTGVGTEGASAGDLKLQPGVQITHIGSSNVALRLDSDHHITLANGWTLSDTPLPVEGSMIIPVGVQIKASGSGRLDVDMNADMTGTGQGYISIDQAKIATNGGAVRLYGQSLPDSGFANGVSIRSSSINAADLRIYGSSQVTGVDVHSSDLLASGNLTVRGRADAADGRGVKTQNSTLTGIAGVDIVGEAIQEGGIGTALVGDTHRIESTAGSVSIRGIGNSAGIDLSTMTASGRDGVELRGIASSGDGVRLYYPTIDTSAGRILITGDAAGQFGAGLSTQGGTIGGPQQRGDIVLRARSANPNIDSISLNSNSIPTMIETSGSVVLLPGGLSPNASAIIDAHEVPITINSSSHAAGFDIGPDDLSTLKPQTALIIGSDNHYGKITLGDLESSSYDLTLQNRGLSPSGTNDGIAIGTTRLSGKTLTLASRGDVQQTESGYIVADSLVVLSDPAAQVTLTNSNGVRTLAAENVGSLNFETDTDLVLGSVSGFKTFEPVQNTVVTNTVTNSSSTGDFTVRAYGSLKLAQSVTTTDPASTITLAAGGNFSSSGSLQPGGRFLVYDGDGPANTILNGINYDFLQFDAPYTTSPAQSSGSGVLYATPLELALHYSRTYDGTTSALIDSPTSLRVDLPTGYGVSRVDSPGAGSFSSKNVSQNQPLMLTTQPVLGLTDANGKPIYYSTSSGFSYSGDITPKLVTLDGFDAASKTYDGTTAATIVSADSLSGVIAGDAVSVANTGATFADRNAGTGKTVTLNGVSLAGAGAGNYRIASSASDTADIAQKALTLDGFDAASKTYDGTTAATIVSAGSLSGVVAGDAVRVANTGATFADRNAGAGKTVTLNGVSLAGAGAGNYRIASSASDTADITQKALTLDGFDAASKTYDGTTAATIVSAGSLSGVIAGDAVSVANSGATFADRNAGAGKTVTLNSISLAGADAGNYVLGTEPVTTTASITPRLITANATAADKIYDGNRTATVTGSTLNGILAGDSLSLNGLTGLFDTIDVGLNKTVSVSGGTLTGLDAGNYMLADVATTTIASITSVRQNDTAAVIAAYRAVQAAKPIEKPFTANATSSLADSRSLLSAGSVTDFSALPQVTATSLSGTNYFAPVNVAGMAPADLTRLLDSRREFKRKLFADAIDKLELDPTLADVQPCASAAQAASGLCRITPEQIAELQAASASPPAAVTKAALPTIQRKFAVFFGLNDYQDDSIPKLESAIPDADAVSRVFAERLGYEVRVVHNPGKADILRTLNQIAVEAGSADSVVIYYAGHGYSQGKNGIGYWLPSDAPVGDPKRWISNDDIARLIAGYRSTQVALISDSCYSGAFAREGAGGIGQAADAVELLARRSVVVLSSGGDEPVFDDGKEGHSIFAWNLMQALNAVSSWTPGTRVFEKVRSGVVNEFPQTPHYAAVSAAGHQPGGEYLFEVR